MVVEKVPKEKEKKSEYRTLSEKNHEDEQQQLEQHLIEAQRFGRSGSWEWNLQTKHSICSEGLLSLFEVNQEISGTDIFKVLLEKVYLEDVGKLRKLVWRVLREHAPMRQEFRILRSDGTRQIMQCSCNILVDRQNRPLKLIGTVCDITAIQESAEKHREEALRLREFIQTMPDRGLIVDERGTVVELLGNSKLFGEKSKQDVFGKQLNDFMPRQAAREMLESIQYVLEHQTLQFGEYDINTNEGNRTFRFRFAPMSYETGGKRTVACTASDITEQSRTKKFLQVSYEKRRQQELLNKLVEGKIQPSPTVLDQAWQVKLNLAQSFSCQLLLVEKWDGSDITYWQENRMEFQFLLDSLVEVIERELEAIVWESKEGIGLLMPLATTCRNSKQHELEFAEQVRKTVNTHFPTVVLSMGMAEFFADSFQNISAAYSQACDAAYLGQLMEPDRCVHHYLDLGVLQILPSLADQERVASFIKRTLGNLLDYDKKKGSQLVDTLEKILQNENLKAVAEQSFVHHQTIVFRKKRIEEILGVSLESFETRLTLGIALKLCQVFSRRKSWRIEET